MKNIVVIGAGTMGNGIAHVFAMTGHSVNLVDISADALNRAVATISKNLTDLASLRPIIKQHKKAIASMKNKQKSVESGNEAAKQLDEENEKPKKINRNIYT